MMSSPCHRNLLGAQVWEVTTRVKKAPSGASHFVISDVHLVAAARKPTGLLDVLKSHDAEHLPRRRIVRWLAVGC